MKRRDRELERKAYYGFPPRTRAELVLAARLARLVLLGMGAFLVLVAVGAIR